ncbi:MAG: hypothetical protein HYW70_02760 [Candidatus Nealsonbacteria bacterium]|nr:hypothetical protein [Candidatus Nealsonbacteria bacterium]
MKPMNRKFVILVLAVLFLAGGFFYWWNNQADVRGLNKTLPDGVRVTKSFFGSEYKVVNKIDGYSFKVPPEWKGVKEIEYVPERTEQGYTGTSISVEGSEGIKRDRVFTIDKFKIKEQNIDLLQWVKDNFKVFELVGEFTQESIGGFEIVKTRENIHLLGMYIYHFQRNFAAYSITGGSEEFIRYIIANGKW